MKLSFILLGIVLSLMALLLSGCSGGDSTATAAGGIQAYFEALIAKEADQLTNSSCTDWETQAQLELESFGAVKAELQDLQCSESGQDGDATIVSCSGIISATYGNEILEIDLADRQYLAVYEGSEWRMCGYR